MREPADDGPHKVIAILGLIRLAIAHGQTEAALAVLDALIEILAHPPPEPDS